MLNGLAYILPTLRRNPRRTGAYLIGTVLAVSLLASVLFYVVGSAQVLTQRSIASVRVDMQAVASNAGGNVTGLRRALVREPGVARAERFALAGFSRSELRSGTRVGQTGPGKIVAVDPSYFSTFGVPVIRQGGLGPTGVVISQDLGTNLGARVGDVITLRLGHGSGARRFRVTGVASMLGTDVLFAPLDPVLRANPFNPPANVVLMGYGYFERHVKPLVLRQEQVSTGAVVVRRSAPVSEQVQLRIDRSLVPADPTEAKLYTTGLRHRLELAYTGRMTIIDNLFAALDQAQADVLWAQVILVFLTLPGVILAAALSRYVTAAVIEAQQRELALLRIRGVAPGQLLALLAVALLLVALAGVVVGLGTGWLTVRVLGDVAHLSTGPLFVRTLFLAVGAGLILGAVSTFWPLVRFLRTPITEARRRVARGRAPLWRRLYLDVLSLTVGLVIYAVTQRNGFQPVLNAEGNPTLSLSFFTFLAPLLVWLGTILLLVRVSGWLVESSGRLLHRSRGGRQGVVGELASRTLTRRSGPLQQVIVLVAMGVAFSTGLLTFVHTYEQQQRVDAELTLGSDVKVSMVNRSQSAVVARRLGVPGVAAATPFRSTVAYVGAEIQDIFGISVPSFLRATRPANAFFVGGSARETLMRLARTRNGILVSAETARDYSLNVGDSLLLRLVNAQTHRYVPARFRLVGVVREFATAPKDAFLVTNLAYLQTVTHDRGVDAFLIRTNGPVEGVAAALRGRFAAGPVVQVTDLSHVQQQLATSLTSLNMSSLSRIDYVYSVVMILTALLVFTLTVVLERARDFAMLEVVGVTPRQLRRLLLVEVVYAAGVGSVLGVIVGLIFAQMLVQILTSIFDPPPEVLAISWASLGVLFALIAGTTLLAWLAASLRLGRMSLAGTLRET